MKQVYVSNNLVGDKLEHDYDLKYEEGKTICLFSQNSEWCKDIRGIKAGSVKDIDDGYLIKVGEQKMKIGFAEMQVLKILLLSEINDSDYFEIRETTTIKKWPQAEDTETEENLR